MKKNIVFYLSRISKDLKTKVMVNAVKQKVKSSFIVINEKGLHTRPSTELVKCASAFKSQVNLVYQNMTVNAKSLLGILMLAASRGAKIKVEAEGEDAPEAVQSILALAKNKFHIKY
jgi:phosphocarrier protein